METPTQPPQPPRPVYKTRQFWGAVFGSVGFVLLVVLAPGWGLGRQGQNAAAVAWLMACFWIGETIPIFATSLFPIILFPVLGVLDPKKVTLQYGNEVVFLMMGGFMLAEALQKWELHRRIALHTIRVLGGSPSRLLLGFMVATAFLSMWMSNSATAVMMLPIGVSVVLRLGKHWEAKVSARFATALCLGIAYSASIGGVATLVGTPPNAIFAGQIHKLFPDAPELFFYQWMLLGVPVAGVMLVAAWLVLARVLFRVPGGLPELGRDMVRGELAALGPMKRGERAVLVIFVVTAGLWISRGLWQGLLPAGAKVSDTTVAMLAAAALFLYPVDLRRGEFALDWRSAARLPWGVLVLFGGGFALAAGLSETGLARWTGERLVSLPGLHPLAQVALLCFAMTFITEVTSNTAIATIMMPIMAFAAPALGVHPYLLMVPATFSASCAFMLPSGTPPNAIVFGSGQVRLPQMARAGVLLNLIGVVVITVLCYYLGGWALGGDWSTPPAWLGGQALN